jgi:regulator of sirC expression with transglutaminase-like and TPR domain
MNDIKLYLSPLLVACFFLSSVAETKDIRQKAIDKNNKPSNFIQKLLDAKEADIDLAKIALELAKEIDPTVNVKADLKKIKLMSNEVKKKTLGSTFPKIQIDSINQFLYKDMGLQYDFSDPKAKGVENNLLSHTLKTQKGSCLTMPLLYMAIAQQLKIPIYPVVVQNHMFLRYTVPGGEEINIEATSGGSFPNSYYINRFQVSSDAVSNGNYMKTYSYKEIAGILLLYNSQHYFKQSNHKKAFEYIDAAMKMFPRNPNLVMAKAVMFRDLWSEFQKKFRMQEAEVFWQLAKEYSDKAKAMGIKNLDESEYLKQIRSIASDVEASKKVKPMM